MEGVRKCLENGLNKLEIALGLHKIKLQNYSTLQNQRMQDTKRVIASLT